MKQIKTVAEEIMKEWLIKYGEPSLSVTKFKIIIDRHREALIKEWTLRIIFLVLWFCLVAFAKTTLLTHKQSYDPFYIFWSGVVLFLMFVFLEKPLEKRFITMEKKTRDIVRAYKMSEKALLRTAKRSCNLYRELTREPNSQIPDTILTATKGYVTDILTRIAGLVVFEEQLLEPKRAAMYREELKRIHGIFYCFNLCQLEDPFEYLRVENKK